MREDRQPFLRNRFGWGLLLAADGLQRVEIERHAPGDVDVRGRGDEVSNVAGNRTI